MLFISFAPSVVFANYAGNSNLPGFAEEQYYLAVEILSGESAFPEDREVQVDESGWDGRVFQDLSIRGGEYASNSSRIDAVAAVERSKCKPQKGLASWYGGIDQGGPTASGQRFNTHELTAANRTLPLGTRVRVTNKRNSLSVVVTINDRGPFVRGRVIDLSQAAAEALKIVVTNERGKIVGDQGVGAVEVDCI